jgi:hypothetical protein
MTATVPEAQARTMLREHCSGDGLEGWLADQPWHAAEDGSWRVEPSRNGRTFRVEGVPGQSVRIVERTLGSGAVTSWLIGP